MRLHESTPRAAAALAMLGLFGCGTQAEDGRNPMGSQAMVTSQDHQHLYLASPDDDLVVTYDIQSGGQTKRVRVEGEPTRVARIDDRVLVTLRARRQIAELIDDGEQLTPARTIDVGAEPYGIVANEAGTRVYYAESTGGRVIELDGARLEPLRAWKMDGEPRWLALHPSGRSLFVGGFAPDSLFVVNLDSGQLEQLQLPEVEGFDPQTGIPTWLSARITGDLAASPDGKLIAVPTLYVDNNTPLLDPDPDNPDDPVDDTGYGGRLNPTIVLIEVDGDGRAKPDRAKPVLIQSNDGASYPASVTFSPDSKVMVATLEGSDAVAILPAGPDEFFHGELDTHVRGDPFIVRSVTMFGTPAGPRATAFFGDAEAAVFSFIDREVSIVPDWIFTDVAGFGATIAQRTSGRKFTETTLDPAVEEGRRLFYSSVDPRVSGVGQGVSCATCHFEGRDDGITWNFERGLRQTPSLAGEVSLRAPFTWTGAQSTVADDAMSTASGLMRGTGLSARDADNIAAFIDYTRAVDHPGRDGDAGAIQRGKALFESEGVGCAECHRGAQLMDGETHALRGTSAFRTPSLIGVAASAPYMHDGALPDLRSVLEAARDGRNGDTSGLSEPQMQDLEAYLRSL